MGARLVLAGAGGFGRGVFAWIRSSPEYMRRHEIDDVVFIDDATPGTLNASPIVGGISDYAPESSDVVLCTVGVPSVRRLVVARLEAAGARFASFVHDSVVLGDRVEIGDGVVVCPGSILSSDVKVGDHVHVNFNCSIGHDVQLGAYSSLSPGVNVMGEVVCGTSVFFGGGAIVLPRLRLENDATVGAGAVVTKSVTEGVTVTGVPADYLPSDR